jgi:hypothetical protein
MHDFDGPRWGDLDDLRWGDLHAKRRPRELQRAKFLDKAERTPPTARRWFRIEDIEPNAHARSNLVHQLRASIWHRDLCLGGKSQVLCLSVSPLAENRFDPDMARWEHFNALVGDLWMSVPRWLAWFRQDGTNRKAPAWLEVLATRGANCTEEFWSIPEKEPPQKALRIAWRALRAKFPDGRIPNLQKYLGEKLAEIASKVAGEIISRETVLRLLGRKP